MMYLHNMLVVEQEVQEEEVELDSHTCLWWEAALPELVLDCHTYLWLSQTPFEVEHENQDCLAL
ncbi:hypothetical protein Hanom_Chr16g01491641 [Helianthus anomalus]